jgi:hypothetical protein
VMELPEFTWPLRMTGSDMTGNGHDWNRKSWPWSRAHVQPFPAVFSYYGSKKCRTVVQVPVLPDEILKGVPMEGVWACATGSCPYCAIVYAYLVCAISYMCALTYLLYFATMSTFI